MTPFCQIEYVSSDSDVDMPCVSLLSRHPQFDSTYNSASEVEDMTLTSIIEVVVILVVIIAAVRFFVKRA